jgi:hypothetical protein
MKITHTIVMILIIACVLSTFAGCQEPQKAQETPKKIEKITPKPEKPKKTPKIQLEKTVHNFGKMGPGKSKTCNFVFKNVGDGELVIKKIQSTCGCTVPQLKKKKYAPGESGTIKVTFRVPTNEGPTTKHLYILSNAPKKPRYQFSVKAAVEVTVSYTPKRLNLDLREENAAAPKIILKSKDDQPFSIKSITSSQKTITVEFDRTVKATEFILEPKVDKEKLQKYNNGNIRIMVTHPGAGVINITYNAKAPFTLSRQRIIIRDAEPQKTITKDTWIISNYGIPIEIESISSKNNYMKVISREKKDDKRIKLTIEVTPPDKPSQKDKDKKPKRYFTDNLTIKIKGGYKLVVNCNGWYKTKQGKNTK